jgi:hypothetical protein
VHTPSIYDYQNKKIQPGSVLYSFRGRGLSTDAAEQN